MLNLEDLKLLWQRVLKLKFEVCLFTFASLIDLAVLGCISLIFNEIQKDPKNLINNCIYLFIIIILRTIIIYALKHKAYAGVFIKKNDYELHIIDQFVRFRHKNLLKNDSKQTSAIKDKLINTSNLATVNFDMPILSILSEIIIAIGGMILILLNIGIIALVSIIPLLLIVFMMMKRISLRLRSLGQEILNLSSSRMTKIDNIIENSSELILEKRKSYLNYLNNTAQSYNLKQSNQINYGALIQLIIEASSYLIISIFIVFFTSDLIHISASNAAASIAIAARLVPTITRTISSLTQLNYGIPAVLRLNHHE